MHHMSCKDKSGVTGRRRKETFKMETEPDCYHNNFYHYLGILAINSEITSKEMRPTTTEAKTPEHEISGNDADDDGDRFIDELSDDNAG